MTLGIDQWFQRVGAASSIFAVLTQIWPSILVPGAIAAILDRAFDLPFADKLLLPVGSAMAVVGGLLFTISQFLKFAERREYDNYNKPVAAFTIPRTFFDAKKEVHPSEFKKVALNRRCIRFYGLDSQGAEINTLEDVRARNLERAIPPSRLSVEQFKRQKSEEFDAAIQALRNRGFPSHTETEIGPEFAKFELMAMNSRRELKPMSCWVMYTICRHPFLGFRLKIRTFLPRSMRDLQPPPDSPASFIPNEGFSLKYQYKD